MKISFKKQKGKKSMKQKHEETCLTAIDLFAGGGGLTVGLKKAGFKVMGAVEIDKSAFATYKTNHPEVKAIRQDIREVNGDTFKSTSRGKAIDLVAGCPPCQGFSSLTAKYKKLDPRNELIFEMSRLINEIKPNAVMLENVPGLAIKGRPLFDTFLKNLADNGYVVNYKVLQVADYGVPQNRKRLVLLAGKGFSIDFPRQTHSRNPSGELLPWNTVGSIIKNMPSPKTLEDCQKQGGPQAYNWHVIRSIAPQNMKRLLALKAGDVRFKIPKELRPSCHKELNKGFGNVYGRMSWNEVSPTITGGCTTLSKGRFGHPEENRTISVREAALLQTFPKDYIFDTQYMEQVCNVIGNALPCTFAEILSKEVFKTLEENYGKMAENE